MTLKDELTYDIYLVIDEDTRQYKKLTVSDNVEDKEFILYLRSDKLPSFLIDLQESVKND